MTEMSVQEKRFNGVYGGLQVGTEGASQPTSLGIRSRSLTVLGKLAMVVFTFLAVEAMGATGLNADGLALLEFKKAIASDPQDALKSWSSADDTPCLWNGIDCATIQATMEDRVVSIALPRMALGGTLSPKLGDLAFLVTLNLQTNKLTGGIPAELFKASGLSRLFLSDNNLTGDIPAQICNLGQELRELEIKGNHLTSLPDDIVACFRLRRLVLSYNNISGSIPIGIGSNLKQLERIDLSENEFNGSIPEDFGNLSTLQEALNLSNNHLSGTIPQSLARLGRVLIDVSNNNISGPIPADSYFQSQGPTAYSGNPNLCGLPLKIDCAPSPLSSPAPSPSGRVAASESSISNTTLSKGAAIGIGIGCGIAGLLMATGVFYFFMRKPHLSKKCLRLQTSARSESTRGLRGCLCSWRDSAPGNISAEEEEDDEKILVHLTGVMSFTLVELLRASAYVLGKSGVGIVYKAVLDEGTVVAVRRLGEGGEQRRKEFEAELKSIAQVRHVNIVSLHSYSWTADEKLLIYDYLSNGNLESALHGRSDGSKGPLTWEARLRIARGSAQGIAHIHECSPRKYIHGDIKPGNILLDAFLEARIADFGLQRLLLLAVSESGKELGSTRSDTGRASAVSPAPIALPEFGRRSFSPRGHMVAPFLMGVYQAPEAINAKKPTQKSDVYSFGVVLLELLTGRSPFKQLAAGQLDLVSWIRVALQEKKALSEIFDPCLLKSSYEQSKMIDTLQVALACLAVHPDSRPKMKQVAEFFEQLQASS